MSFSTTVNSMTNAAETSDKEEAAIAEKACSSDQSKQ